MTYSFRLSRRIARLRAPMLGAIVLTLVACNDTDSFNPDSSTPPGAIDQPAETAVPVDQPELAKTAAASSRGLAFGFFAQPVTEFGNYSGAMLNISPGLLLRELAEIKQRGGRVVVMFVGSEQHYKDRSGHFDMNLWKARLNRYKGINFSSYINDGTIIGHYLIDEPYDPVNWHGKPVPGSVVDQMAQYSKSLWPSMTTIARAEPAQLGNGSFRYLDAAWAQFTYNKGNPDSYISRNVSDAQKRGLNLVVGLNVTHGGKNRSTMTTSQISAFGSALLKSSYPCAFISWKYNHGHMSSSSVRSAMEGLRRQAAGRSAKSCG